MVIKGVKKQDAFLKNHLVISYDSAALLLTICSIGFPLFYFLYRETESLSIDMIGFIVSFAGLLGLFFDRKRFHYYWLIYLIYVFPFNFTYNYFNNISNTIYSTGVAIMLVAVPVIVSDAIMSIVVIGLGMGVSYTIVDIENANLYSDLFERGIIYAYLFAVLIGLALDTKKNIEKRNKIKGALAISHSIAHEIKTPATAIKNYSAELKQISHPVRTINNTIQKSVDVIDRQVNNLSTTVDFLLTNAKCGNGKKNQHLQSVSMYKCIDQAIETFPYQNRINKKNIFWKKTEDFIFRGEQTMMRNVLFNLIKNSINSLLEKGAGEISIYNTKNKKFNTLFFCDTGGGAAKNNLNHLFKGFFTTCDSGTGLGLFYCKNIITNFGGEITVESEYSEYFRVIIKLPIVPQ